MGSLDIAAQNWTHSIGAFGGFDRAEFSIVAPTDTIEDWIEDGIGRVIRTYDETGTVIWEGFVNRISVRQSGLELTIGPITDIVNRAKLVYSTFDVSVSPPFQGIRKETSVSNNTLSQLRYGVYYKALSASGVTDTNAIHLRDMYLTQHAWPETTSSFSPQSSVQQLQVECLGFIHMLDFPYNRILTPAEINISTKITQILAADPNVLFTDYSQISTNTVQVSQLEEENRSGYALLKSLTALGDSGLNRWVLGAYENRTIEYRQAPNQIHYLIELRDSNFTVYDTLGAVVRPWHVRPGRWVLFSDFLPAFTPEQGDLNQDPRALFIEEVKFNLPYGVQLNGGKTTKLSQRLAQLGLAGISA